MARKKSFSGSLKGAGKTNSHPAAVKAKAELRALVLDEIGPDNAVVFDAFAGAGSMHEQVWHRAASYVGCDLVWYRDARRAFVADNRRVLRAIDLRPFNIFDLDAYGSPWEQALIVADRRPLAPGERIGMLLTEGSGLNMKLGGMAAGLRVLAGMKPGVAGASRQQDSVIDRAIGGHCQRMRARVVRRWQAAGKTGASMRYIGLIIEGNE
jgi:hypothetical protein